jgi:Fe-S-cluster containining protein
MPPYVGGCRIHSMTRNGDEHVPWYRRGLAFQCTRCGHCCTGAPGFVWVDHAEMDAIAAFLGEDRAEFTAVRTRQLPRGRSLRERANGDCVFYDAEAGCTIYPVRPRQCRTWPFWESNLASPEAWEETCRICPGSGHGELVPAEEITRRMKVIRL